MGSGVAAAAVTRAICHPMGRGDPMGSNGMGFGDRMRPKCCGDAVGCVDPIGGSLMVCQLQ